MQLLLPIFPPEVKLITHTFGVFARDGIVNYLHCGVPIYSHAAEDLNSFRYITSKFVLQGLCKQVEISRCFGISYDSVKRNTRRLAEQGERVFFASDPRGGQCYKLLPAILDRMQRKLDGGTSNSEIARLEGVTEGAVRYAIKHGKLKKTLTIVESGGAVVGSHRTERSVQDHYYGDRMGIATRRETERVAASLGKLPEALPLFEPAHNVCQAGVLLLLPALLAQGLLKGQELYGQLKKGYYGLVTVLLLLCFMALSRIKTPEQLKQGKVGELGRLLGLDRCPETKCLRHKIEQIVAQGKAQDYNTVLFHQWLPASAEDSFYFYVDGHVRVYHGRQGKLPKKYVARQKLCLPGTTEYWVNDQLGMPYLVVTGQLNAKLKQSLTEQIIPLLVKETAGSIDEEQLLHDADRARFTIIFDREAYDPKFFKWLWETYRIAVITYRKHVKDKWSETTFSAYEVEVIAKQQTMLLGECTIELGGMVMREIRKLSDSGHQTSVLTTNRQITTAQVGGRMFSRWSQENYFRYMVHDYDLDRMVEYGIDNEAAEQRVVNPCYNQLTQQLKKVREKQGRLQAKFYKIIDENLAADLDKLREHIQDQSELQEKIQLYQLEIDQKLTERNQTDYYIAIKDMPEHSRYNRLKTESKLFMNVMKMIAYRAETAVLNLLLPYYQASHQQGRMLVKEIIQSDADLIPDYGNNTLTVRLHTLSTPRANHAVMELCKILNDTETVYPNTNLKLVYEMV